MSEHYSSGEIDGSGKTGKPSKKGSLISEYLLTFSDPNSPDQARSAAQILSNSKQLLDLRTELTDQQNPLFPIQRSVSVSVRRLFLSTMELGFATSQLPESPEALEKIVRWSIKELTGGMPIAGAMTDTDISEISQRVNPSINNPVQDADRVQPVIMGVKNAIIRENALKTGDSVTLDLLRAPGERHMPKAENILLDVFYDVGVEYWRAWLESQTGLSPELKAMKEKIVRSYFQQMAKEEGAGPSISLAPPLSDHPKKKIRLRSLLSKFINSAHEVTGLKVMTLEFVQSMVRQALNIVGKPGLKKGKINPTRLKRMEESLSRGSSPVIAGAIKDCYQGLLQ